MNEAPVLLRPRALMNNRPRSGSWSNYQYYKQQQQQQQQKQHTLFQETKHSKPSFLIKLMQKRPGSCHGDERVDDESCLVEPQTPPTEDSLHQVSKGLNGHNPLAKRKKDKSLGRFLKRWGKNPATVIASVDDNDPHGSVTLPTQMQEQPSFGTPATDPVTTSLSHQNSIVTTPASMPTISVSPAKSTQDDFQLHYYRANDFATFAPLVPRSTSFDTVHGCSTPPPRFFAPDSKSHYSKLARCTSPKDTRALLAGIYTLGDAINTQHDSISDSDDDDDDDDSMDETAHGDDDPLTKRLSGGHFGSAGGLIINTLSLTDLSTIETPLESTQLDGVSEKEADVAMEETMETTAENYARRIWEQDDTVYSSLEHVVEWIGNGSPSSQRILKAYMSYFDFTRVRLEDAFRQVSGRLCGKLSMKAESQQIDRILEEFSKRYHHCNPQSIFGTSDIIHAVVYSLVLLNTDLHVAQGERKKMSRPAFVRNTMNAIQSQLTQDTLILDDPNSSNISAVSLDDDRLVGVQSQAIPHEWIDLKRTPSCRSTYSQTSSYSGKMSSSFDVTSSAFSSTPFGSLKWQNELESVLKQLYTSVRHKQIMQPEAKTGATAHSTRTHGHRYKAFKRNVGTMMWKAARDSLFIGDTKSMDIDFPQPSTPGSTISSRRSLQRRQSISSIRSGVSQHSHVGTSMHDTVGYQAVASLLYHSDLPTSYTSAAPYYKEGMLVRKHLMEQADQKARQRDWKECFMVVDRGEIRMYRLDGQRRKANVASHPLQGMVHRGASLATVSESLCDHTDPALGGGDWLTHAQVIGEVDLKHTLSNALPSGYSRRRRHAFALQQANGGVYLFQVGSAEQVMEWVSTCNYWAARESKEPLMGGVGNLEYGWGACLEEKESSPITVSHWQPPIPPLMASSLNEMAQLDTLLQHVKTLNDALDHHRDLKLKMEERFAQESPNRTCAIANFEKKTHYLLHEIIKYQNYCDSIETSLALQDKAIQLEKKEDTKIPS